MSKPFKSYKVKSKHWDTQKNLVQIQMIEEEDVKKRTLKCSFKVTNIYSFKDSLPQLSKKNVWSTVKGEDDILPQCL